MPNPRLAPADLQRSRGSLRQRLQPALLSAGLLLPVGLALHYCLNVVLARVMTVEGYGTFAFAQSLATILALVAAMGFSTSMLRLVTGYCRDGEFARLRGLVTGSLSIISAAAMLLALLLSVIVVALPEHRKGLVWAAVILLPLTLDAWREASMRGLHRTTAAILPRQVLLPLLTLSLVLGLGLKGEGAVLLAFAGALLTVELVGLIQLRQTLSFLTEVRGTYRLRYWLRVSVPMGGAALLQLGINRWDIVVLGFVAGLEPAGMYAAAARTALLASLVLRVVNLVVGPVLAELFHAGDFNRFRKLLVAAAALATLAGLPLYLLVMFRPDWILGLFGGAYEQATLPLQILATGQFINLMTGPTGLALAMSKHEDINLWLGVAGAMLSLIGLAVMAPTYGAVGAAAATAFAISAVNLCQVVACIRLFSASRLAKGALALRA